MCPSLGPSPAQTLEAIGTDQVSSNHKLYIADIVIVIVTVINNMVVYHIVIHSIVITHISFWVVTEAFGRSQPVSTYLSFWQETELSPCQHYCVGGRRQRR